MKIVQDDDNNYYNSPLFIIMELNLHLVFVISGYILMALDKINFMVQIHS